MHQDRAAQSTWKIDAGLQKEIANTTNQLGTIIELPRPNAPWCAESARYRASRETKATLSTAASWQAKERGLERKIRAIRIRDLRVDYDDFCAVDDLTLSVEPGEVCGLIGPNGAGKTTTMKALLGLIEPTYGEIEVMGVDMRERPEDVYRVMGFMPDFPPVYEDLLVWEFLDMFAASYGIPRARRPAAVDRFLELVGLLEKRKSLVIELSRGMRQRLMLAKTLIPDPRVLLLDEPASGGPCGSNRASSILRRLAEEKWSCAHLVAHPYRDGRVSHRCGDQERGGGLLAATDEVNQRIMGIR